MEWETLGKHCCAQLSCLQQPLSAAAQRRVVVRGEYGEYGELSHISYRASPTPACSVGLECVTGGK